MPVLEFLLCVGRNLHLQASHLLRHIPPSMAPTTAARSFAGGEQQPSQIAQMSAHELGQLLQDPDKSQEVQFVDVREPEEHSLASLPNFKLWPLQR